MLKKLLLFLPGILLSCAFSHLKAQTVTGVLKDSLSGDVNHDGKVSAGDTLRYQAKIKVTASTATSVSYTNNTPANTQLIAGSVKTSPLARNDAFSVGYNTQFTGNVLTNDFGIPTPAVVNLGPISDYPDNLVVVTNQASTENGGVVDMASDGSFTYYPPQDFNGTDSFMYVVSNGIGPVNTATVQLTIAGTEAVPAKTILPGQ